MSENPFKEARYILDDYPPHFPPKEYFVDKNKVTKKQLEDFCNLIKSDPGETPIDEFLRKNKEVMANCLSIFNTGHHGAWIIPQQIIRPPSAAARGLIPDYILGGKSSDGFFWWVLDLKGSDTNIFRRSGDRLFFSQNVNKGVFQVLEYIDTCSEMQSYMRDTLKLTDFREPKGLLLVGREKELTEDEKKQKLRASWNRNSKSLQIRTYDALIRQIQAKIKVISSS